MIMSTLVASPIVTALSSAVLAADRRDDGPWGPPFGWLFVLVPLFWIGVVALVVALVGRRWRRSGGPGARFAHWESMHGTRSAEATLGERFAQGDIDEKEYRARLEVLRANRVEQPPR
ncbi:MAG: hypothetical protein RI885_1943 [Actinomycetota bacterium]